MMTIFLHAILAVSLSSAQVVPPHVLSEGVSADRCRTLVTESVPSAIEEYFEICEGDGVPRPDIQSKCVTFARGDQKFTAIASVAGPAVLTVLTETTDGQLERVAEAVFPSMGETPFVELLDLDGDGFVELLASTSSPNGRYTRYAAARFDGQGLEFIDPRSTDEYGDLLLLLLNPSFADLDGDGFMEVFAADENDESVVYYMTQGRYAPDARLQYAYRRSIGRVEGKPNVFSDSFDLDDFEGPYEIVVYPDKARPFPASASVVVNGVEVVAERDFKPGVTSIRKPVLLRALNDFRATVYGKPGSYAHVVIVEAKPE